MQPSSNPLNKGKELEHLLSIDHVEVKDYTSISENLLKKGAFSLLHGDPVGIEFFDMAIKLAPSNANMHFEQGLSLFEYGSAEGKVKALTLASKRLKAATLLNPNRFEAWHAWGNTLYLLGLRKKEASYFFNAKKKYEKAMKLSSHQPYDVLADLHWDYGNLWNQIAAKSGETNDLLIALKSYQKAHSYQEDLPADFWLSFGDISLKLSKQTNDIRLHLKSVNCFKNALSINISDYYGWFKLASAINSLYRFTHEEDHFDQANECFATSAQLAPHKGMVWCGWAKLLLEYGLNTEDTKILRSCIDKCKKGRQLKDSGFELFAIWSEALSSLGILTDRLDLIYDAQNKILEIETDSSYFFYPSGTCLMALGTYFKDPDFHYQAVEHFQKGLSINRANHKLWYGLGIAYTKAGLLDHDEQNFENAIKFFTRALHLRSSTSYHFHFGLCLYKFGEMLHNQTLIERSIMQFEQALNGQKNAIYVHPNWLFQYACSLDLLGEFIESEESHSQALDILNNILTIHPQFPSIHYQIALVYSHYGESNHGLKAFYQALHHFKIAEQRDKENDQIIHDWALTLLNLGDLMDNKDLAEQYFLEAEHKMIQAIKLGNTYAFYSISCLYSLLRKYEKALYFLKKSQISGTLPSFKELLEDEWLEGLRNTDEFQSFLQTTKSP